MLDFGWPELFLIIALAVIVIGPQEIPALMVALGRIARRLHYIKFSMSQQFEGDYARRRSGGYPQKA